MVSEFIMKEATMRYPHEFPVVGTWYWDIEQHERFEIVALDQENKEIEIQYFSGEIEEIDEENWFAMRVVAIAPPNDWSGPFEIDKDQFSDLNDEVIHPHHRPDPLQPFENSK